MAVIHSLSPGLEDQVSRVRREKRRSGNQKPDMKLHKIKKANRGISNIKPRNVEGWNRFAQSFLKQTEYITSTFDIQFAIFNFKFSAFGGPGLEVIR